jgi:putative tricarboxylic transport membrane protein
VGSFVAGSVGILGIALLGSWLADQALRFGPPEYFALSAMGLLVLSRLSGGSVLGSLLLVGAGLALGTVGMEPISGVSRFTFGILALGQGIELVPVIMGLYGVAEVLVLAEQGMRRARLVNVRLAELFPSTEEWRRSAAPIARGSVVGFLTGLVPGPAAVLATFISYALERRLSRTPERFGRGAIEGVAGPEAANNGATAGAMVPLLSLGIPFAPATAILLSALLVHGVQAGPLLMAQRPEVFWGVVASMYVGNLILLVLNLPLVGVFASILKLPQHLLSTLVLLLCLVGTWSLNASLLDLWVLVVMGIAGWGLRKVQVDPAPLIVALVLGPYMETALRQTLYMAHGDWRLLVFRPLALALVLAGVLVVAAPPLVAALRRRPTPTAAATPGGR